MAILYNNIIIKRYGAAAIAVCLEVDVEDESVRARTAYKLDESPTGVVKSHILRINISPAAACTNKKNYKITIVSMIAVIRGGHGGASYT